MTEINKQSIERIAKKNPTAEAIFTLLGCRERNRGDTNINRLKYDLLDEQFQVVPEDLISTFKELERLGIGKLAGHRFKWFVSLKDVGAAGLGKGGDIKTQARAPREMTTQVAVSGTTEVAKTSFVVQTKSLIVALAPHRTITVAFPTDITPDEIRFIAGKMLKESI